MSQQACKKILVTGGAGFIGSAFVRLLLEKALVSRVVNLDLLTYAGNLKHLDGVMEHPKHTFVKGDILDEGLVKELIQSHEIDTLVHFAAESHVDNSICDPKVFYRTNVEGTISLLQCVRQFPNIHFHHISTDEVFGSLEQGEFTETSPYRPNSPYAASKAASDHFVRAWANTYGLSTTMSHSSNNFGPCQHREKFIPKMIENSLKGRPLPVYGKGENIRDWLFVEDHAEAVWTILCQGKRGESYNIGGQEERKNIDLLRLLLELVAKSEGRDVSALEKLVQFVPDRPGHDFRYALNCKKLQRELGWQPKTSISEGLKKTVEWYVKAS